MNILITGLGFITRHLIEQLNSEHNITLYLDNKLSLEQARFLADKDVKVIYDLHNVFYPDIVFHFGANSNTVAAWHNLRDRNLEFTQELVQYLETYSPQQTGEAKGKSFTKLVFASTAGVYGNGLYGFNEESKIDIESLSPYALSKYLGESAILKSSLRDRALVLRLFNVWSYGKHEQHKLLRGQASPHATIVQCVKEDRPVPIYNVQPEPRRDFISVEDATKFIFSLAFSKNCGIFNVGTGVARSFTQVRDFMHHQNYDFDTCRPDFKPSPFYQYFTEADVGKLKSVVPFESKGFVVDFS